VDPLTPAHEERSRERERAMQAAWRPKEGMLVSTLREHTKGVNRMAVAQVGREGGREGGRGRKGEGGRSFFGLSAPL